MNGDTRIWLAATLTAVVLTLGACYVDQGTNGGTSKPPEPPTTSATSAAGSEADPTPKTDVQVDMTDALRFRPPDVVLKVGGKVTWTNPSTVVHSATGDPAKVADATHVELPPASSPGTRA